MVYHNYDLLVYHDGQSWSIMVSHGLSQSITIMIFQYIMMVSHGLSWSITIMIYQSIMMVSHGLSWSEGNPHHLT